VTGNEPAAKRSNSILLRRTAWDDYGFGTSFEVYALDEKDQMVFLGTTKIAKRGMVSKGLFEPTVYTVLPSEFRRLSTDFFSVGQTPEFYEAVIKRYGAEGGPALLRELQDLALRPEDIDDSLNEEAVRISLFRTVSVGAVRGQFRRIALGGKTTEGFSFGYHIVSPSGHHSDNIRMVVRPEGRLSTNVHVVIGPNGSGKTTMLRNIRKAVVHRDHDRPGELGVDLSELSVFTGLVNVSFSAFDAEFATDLDEKQQPYLRFTDIGLNPPEVLSRSASGELESRVPTQQERFATLVKGCLEARRDLLVESMKEICKSDLVLESLGIDQVDRMAEMDFESLSSGHKIVLLTLMSLILYCEEKTLVLMDEPESHLHPPLLSSFTRVVASLMGERNGIAIIATHSPVILQEVPTGCAWRFWRSGDVGKVDPVTVPTFGENLGVLTREIFGLEIERSGFHKVLLEVAEKTGDFETALSLLGNDIGIEAKSILRSMVRRSRQGDVKR